jgi:hypothetical protein
MNFVIIRDKIRKEIERISYVDFPDIYQALV